MFKFFLNLMEIISLSQVSTIVAHEAIIIIISTFVCSSFPKNFTYFVCNTIPVTQIKKLMHNGVKYKFMQLSSGRAGTGIQICVISPNLSISQRKITMWPWENYYRGNIWKYSRIIIFFMNIRIYMNILKWYSLWIQF